MDRSELDITAELALMDLTDDERGQLETAVAQLLEYFSLQEGNRLRSDVLRTDGEAAQALADDILEQAPDLEDRFIAIPNVL